MSQESFPLLQKTVTYFADEFADSISELGQSLGVFPGLGLCFSSKFSFICAFCLRCDKLCLMPAHNPLPQYQHMFSILFYFKITKRTVSIWTDKEKGEGESGSLCSGTGLKYASNHSLITAAVPSGSSFCFPFLTKAEGKTSNFLLLHVLLCSDFLLPLKKSDLIFIYLAHNESREKAVIIIITSIMTWERQHCRLFTYTSHVQVSNNHINGLFWAESSVLASYLLLLVLFPLSVLISWRAYLPKHTRWKQIGITWLLFCLCCFLIPVLEQVMWGDLRNKQ